VSQQLPRRLDPHSKPRSPGPRSRRAEMKESKRDTDPLDNYNTASQTRRRAHRESRRRSPLPRTSPAGPPMASRARGEHDANTRQARPPPPTYREDERDGFRRDSRLFRRRILNLNVLPSRRCRAPAVEYRWNEVDIEISPSGALSNVEFRINGFYSSRRVELEDSRVDHSLLGRVNES
jgi:hypothetical protein